PPTPHRPTPFPYTTLFRSEHRIIGIRPGEKLHEVLLTEDEARHSLETEKGFVILPEHASWPLRPVDGGTNLQGGFHYSSDQNDQDRKSTRLNSSHLVISYA